jgi:hypothetical protein
MIPANSKASVKEFQNVKHLHDKGQVTVANPQVREH